jgi:hypothetical protein
MGGREEIIRDGYGHTTIIEERNTGLLGMLDTIQSSQYIYIYI